MDEAQNKYAVWKEADKARVYVVSLHWYKTLENTNSSVGKADQGSSGGGGGGGMREITKGCKEAPEDDTFAILTVGMVSWVHLYVRITKLYMWNMAFTLWQLYLNKVDQNMKQKRRLIHCIWLPKSSMRINIEPKIFPHWSGVRIGWMGPREKSPCNLI